MGQNLCFLVENSISLQPFSCPSHRLSGRGASGSVSPQEEEELRALASSPSVYDSLARSLAPSIYGSDDLKKAIACLLFGGSRKR